MHAFFLLKYLAVLLVNIESECGIMFGITYKFLTYNTTIQCSKDSYLKVASTPRGHTFPQRPLPSLSPSINSQLHRMLLPHPCSESPLLETGVAHWAAYMSLSAPSCIAPTIQREWWVSFVRSHKAHHMPISELARSRFYKCSGVVFEWTLPHHGLEDFSLKRH